MSGAEFILRKLLFGQRADTQGAAAHTAERGAGVPADDLLPHGVSGGEDFARHESESK